MVTNETTSTATVLLVDGAPQRRAAIGRQLLDGRVQVEAYANLAELAPRLSDSAFVLVHDDGTSIPKLLNLFARSGYASPFICFDEQPSLPLIVKAVQAGALDYLEWPFGRNELITRLNSLSVIIQRHGTSSLRQTQAQSRLTQLTKRERTVLALVANGHTSREIGERLRISPRTVDDHRSRLKAKINVGTSAGAVRLALESGELDSLLG